MPNPPSPPSPASPNPSSAPGPGGRGDHTFQAPTGTRDMYPSDLNRLRYIQDSWRRTSINHGFEEIDGPTFEHLDLYTVKSGEGIVSELFSFERFGGEKKFALRPEFTPTLARMYAAKAGSLPKPTKWFWQQNCFRAERPQRGRLREFCQWNCDIIGGDNDPAAQAEADAECIACCVGMLEGVGLTPDGVKIRISNRQLIATLLTSYFGIPVNKVGEAIELLDQREKIGGQEFRNRARDLVPEGEVVEALARFGGPSGWTFDARWESIRSAHLNYIGRARSTHDLQLFDCLRPLYDAVRAAHLEKWCCLDLSLVRGLAYYTGMVFEVHEASGAERAIAGGGRYDKLIEMFGGPPTPAVGFGMGDVVLSLVLQDKGLMPGDDEIAVRLGLAPDVFVFAAENKENPEITAAADVAVVSTLAAFRRAGLHARRTYKSTRNIGKLLGEATKSRARFALIIETGTMGQLKDLKSGEQTAVSLTEAVDRVRGVVGK